MVLQQVGIIKDHLLTLNLLEDIENSILVVLQWAASLWHYLVLLDLCTNY